MFYNTVLCLLLLPFYVLLLISVYNSKCGVKPQASDTGQPCWMGTGEVPVFRQALGVALELCSLWRGCAKFNSAAFKCESCSFPLLFPLLLFIFCSVLSSSAVMEQVSCSLTLF